MRAGHGAVDQQGFGGAAHAGAPHLGVEHDFARHGQIGGAVHIGVAVALEMLEHRHAAFAITRSISALAAARHDHVDRFGHAQHHAHRGAIGGRHHLHRVDRQARGCQSLVQAGDDRGRRMQAFLAAAQDGGIAGLEAQAAGIGGDVRPAFVDDADHPQRRAHAGDVEPVGPRPARHFDADRIGQRGDLLEPAAIASTRFSLSSRRSSIAPDISSTEAAMSRALAS